MDFDDLEEAVEARAADGDIDEATAQAMGTARPPPKYRGGYLPSVRRSVAWPSYDDLPRDTQARFKRPKQKMALIRLYMFYGAGDSYVAWNQFVDQSPDWCDVIVYEWPSHGIRKGEDIPADIEGFVNDALDAIKPSLKATADGGLAAGAPFALCGHSIGALIMVAFAKRIKQAMGLEPVAAFVLDRAAPEHPLCSEFGERMLVEDPIHFIHRFNPTTMRFQDDEEGRRMLKMWIGDIRHQHFGVKPKGYHTFACPVYVFAASLNWAFDNPEVLSRMGPDELQAHMESCDILTSKKGSRALFDRKLYDDWRRWTSGQCKVIDVPADHNMIKAHTDFTEVLWQTLDKLKAHI